MSRREVLAAATADDLAESVAAMLATRIADAQAAGRIPSIVLTGGGIGTAVLGCLREPGTAAAIDWSCVDLWWGDERYLPVGDPDRNDTAAFRNLLDHVPVDPARVHRIPGPEASASAEDAAAQYAAQLHRHAAPPGAVPAFDVVLLSIGPDGHVASLFPEAPALHETQDAVLAVHGSPKPPPTRVTLTYPAIAAAREVWVLASGPAKADAVRLMLEEHAGPLQVPAVGAVGSLRTLVILDADAAAGLPAGLTRPIA